MDHVTNIIDTLKAADIMAYPIGTKVGKTVQAYAVIKDQGTVPQNKLTGQQIFEVICLAPLADQPALYTLMEQIKAAMQAQPRYKYTGDQAPTELEPSFEGVSQSLIYAMPRRLQ